MNEEPQLAPPGAGLPKIELWVARKIFALRRLTGNRASYYANFLKQRTAMHSLVASCPENQGGKRILIPRPVGLEDSSRYWSVWMTLDHLRIVHLEINAILPVLAQGVSAQGSANTATVKPDPSVTKTVVAAYENSCDLLLATVEKIADMKTQATFRHPWFGPLNALDWFALAGTHLAIHRGQIEHIVAGLGV